MHTCTLAYTCTLVCTCTLCAHLLLSARVHLCARVYLCTRVHLFARVHLSARVHLCARVHRTYQYTLCRTLTSAPLHLLHAGTPTQTQKQRQNSHKQARTGTDRDAQIENTRARACTRIHLILNRDAQIDRQETEDRQPDRHTARPLTGTSRRRQTPPPPQTAAGTLRRTPQSRLAPCPPRPARQPRLPHCRWLPTKT